MGVEFLKRSKEGIQKHVDRQRVRLAEKDFFTRIPSPTRRRIVFTKANDNLACVGDKLVVEAHGAQLRGRLHGAEFGVAMAPPADVVSAVAEIGGAINGVIEKFHPHSGMVEVSLCSGDNDQ